MLHVLYASFRDNKRKEDKGQVETSEKTGVLIILIIILEGISLGNSFHQPVLMHIFGERKENLSGNAKHLK